MSKTDTQKMPNSTNNIDSLHTKITASSITYSNVILHEISLHVMTIGYILNINIILQNKGIKIYRKMHDSRMSVCQK